MSNQKITLRFKRDDDYVRKLAIQDGADVDQYWDDDFSIADLSKSARRILYETIPYPGNYPRGIGGFAVEDGQVRLALFQEGCRIYQPRFPLLANCLPNLDASSEIESRYRDACELAEQDARKIEEREREAEERRRREERDNEARREKIAFAVDYHADELAERALLIQLCRQMDEADIENAINAIVQENHQTEARDMRERLDDLLN